MTGPEVETPYRGKFVSIRIHDSALAEEYAVSSSLNYDSSRNLMITITVQLTLMSRHYYVVWFDGIWCCVAWHGTGRSPYH